VIETLYSLIERPMPTKAKSPLASKTVWLNALTLVAAVGLALLGTDLVKNHPQAVAWIGAAVAVANVVLRFVTSVPIEAKPSTRARMLIFAAVVLCGSEAIAQQPRQPQMVPYQDLTIPAQHWRKTEVWEQRWSLFGGPYWVRRVQWQPLFPERQP
jgi:hypothetical protein